MVVVFFFFGTPIQTKRRRNEKHTRQSKKFHRIQYVRAQNSSRNETSEEEKMESKMERYNCKIERRTISDPCNNEARKHFFFLYKTEKTIFFALTVVVVDAVVTVVVVFIVVIVAVVTLQ